MSWWRRINLILCLIVVAIAVARFASGNIIGGVVTSLIAAVLLSWTTGFPLLRRARQAWKILSRGSRDKQS